MLENKNTFTASQMQQQGARPRLIHIKKWNQFYDFPSLGMLRKLVFNEHTNGFNRVVRRIGRKVYINENEFFKWVDEQNKN